MTYTPVSMIPGPTQVPFAVREVLSRDYGQNEEDFLPLYTATNALLAQIMGTKQSVITMTGEGMLALWAGLKSCLLPGDKVLAIETGVFGQGIGEMAAGLGCDVCFVSFEYGETISNATAFERIEKAIAEHKPEMITVVHCETPSGTLNPLGELGALKKKYAVPLLYVDAVSSLGGTAVNMDANGIDILLGGSQKCFSAPPNISIMGLSHAAWEKAEKVNYAGYDAILPWRNVLENKLCPYTPYMHGVAALHCSLAELMQEGLSAVFERHEKAAQCCRQGLANLGIKLWTTEDAVNSPTVTAAYIPEEFTWQKWQKALYEQGLHVGGSFGPMHGKVFRLGHMGSQAHTSLVLQALNAIDKVLR